MAASTTGKRPSIKVRNSEARNVLFLYVKGQIIEEKVENVDSSMMYKTREKQ